MLKDINIIGAGGHAVSVASVAIAAGYNVTAFVDHTNLGRRIFDKPVISIDECISDSTSKNYAIGIGDNEARERVFTELNTMPASMHFPKLIHPSSVVCHMAKIGAGSIVMPNSVIGPATNIGEFCILNTNSSIDHDNNLGDFVSIAPSVTTGGNVSIGRSTAISIGSTIKNGITIGRDIVIGAASYVNKDIYSPSVCYGIPCKTIRPRTKGTPYLS